MTTIISLDGGLGRIITAIPALQEEPYIDWKYWWETYTHKSKSFELNYK